MQDSQSTYLDSEKLKKKQTKIYNLGKKPLIPLPPPSFLFSNSLITK